MAAMNIDLPRNWLRAVAAGAEAAVLTWLLAVLGALVTYVATAAAPGLGDATWASTAAVGTGWWTLALGGRIPVEEGTVSLAPLGITLLAAVLLRGAARRMAVDTLAGAAIAAGSFAVAVAALGLVAGRGSGTHVAGALAVGAVGALWALRPEAFPRIDLPPGVRAGLATAGVALLILVGVGAALVAASVVASWDQVAGIHSSLRPDVASAVVLTLAQVAYLPTLAVWALAWLAGPGFAVGEGTVYSALGTTTELLPAIPVLGALPAPGVTVGWAPAVPAVLGVLVGWWRTRGRPLPHWRGAAVAAATFLAVTGAVILVLGVAASGSLGPGRMATVGVDAPLLALVLAGGLTGGYVAVLVVRLPATHALLRSLAAQLRGAATPAAGATAAGDGTPSPATPSSPETAASAPSATTAATAPTAPTLATAATALTPAEGPEPVR